MTRRFSALVLAVLCLSFTLPRAAWAAADGEVIDKPTADDIETPLDDDFHVNGLNLSFRNNFLGALEGMTEQLTAVMMEQTLIVGTFLDAKYQLDTQRLLQDLDAQAFKTYGPSTQMCIFGTGVRSLAMADRKGKANAYILGNGLLSRTMNAHGGVTGEGRSDDLRSRLVQYVKTYCNPNDNGRLLEPVCGNARGLRPNADLDFTHLIDGPLTLNVDFTDAALTPDEEDILAMSRNLFGHEPFERIPAELLAEGPQADMGPAAWLFQNVRSLQAVRGVALNSFANIVGMKAQGGGLATPFLQQIVEGMGVPEDEVAEILGENPSYFAQMDVLTRRIFMTPDFFVNLFTQPANVERLGATLQAIRLMSERDRFEASLRREMLISMIVEMKLRDRESEVDDEALGAIPNIYLQ